MDKILETINIINKLEEGSSDDEGDTRPTEKFRLVETVGKYVPFDQIFKELKEINDQIKDDYKEHGDLERLKKDYFDKYYVRYKYESKDKTIYIHYMYPSLSRSIAGYVIFFHYLFVNRYREPRDINDAWPDGAKFDHISADAKFLRYKEVGVPYLSSGFSSIPNQLKDDGIYNDDCLQLQNIKSEEGGYGTLYICISAFFANRILGKKAFLLQASAHGGSFTTEELVRIYYPKFGFKEAKSGTGSMYAKVDNILAKSRCDIFY